MARACVNILDINQLMTANANLENGFTALYSSYTQIEDNIKKCCLELENNQKNLSYAQNILCKAQDKQHQLELQKEELLIQIEALQASLVAASPKQVVAIKAKIDALKKQVEFLDKRISAIKALVVKVNDTMVQIRRNIEVLDHVISVLKKAYNELANDTRMMGKASNDANAKLSISKNWVQTYVDTSLNSIKFRPSDEVRLRTGINNEYAGKLYDYKCLIDKYNETKDETFLNRYNRVKDYKVYFSELDKYGHANPLFEKYEFLHVTFDEVNEENLRKGTCLRGENDQSSFDFLLLDKKLEKMGYSRKQRNEVYAKTNRHHDPDGRTIRLVPKYLHREIKHFGGCSNIKVERAIIGV